jgi:hypothetical protein
MPMFRPITSGPFSGVPDELNTDDWSKWDFKLCLALCRLARREQSNVLRLSASDLMQISGINRRGDLIAARKTLVKAKFIQEPPPGRLLEFVLCDPETGIPYRDTDGSDSGRRSRREMKAAALDELIDSGIPSEESTGAAGNSVIWANLGAENIAKVVTELLPDVDQSNGKEIYFRCPAHDDENASASMNRTNGKWDCHAASCGAKGNAFTLAAIVEHLTPSQANARVRAIVGAKRGPSPSALRKLEADDFQQAVYRNKLGVPWAREDCIRESFTRADGTEGRTKEFQLYGCPPDGKHFNWRFGWIREWRYQLYNRESFGLSSTIVLCEGSKDANRISQLNLVAADDSPVIGSTNILGCDTRWLPQYTSSLEGKIVFLLPDNDMGGLRHVRKVWKAIRHSSTVIPVRLYPKGKRIGCDISDWLDEHNPYELVELLGQQHFKQGQRITDLVRERRLPVIVEGEIHVNV